jgi:hypothetical protein
MAAHALAGCLAASIAPLAAEELQVDISAGSYLEYNDNPRLVGDDVESVVGLVADARLDLAWGAEAWRWHASPRVVGRRYSGAYSLNSRDIFADAGYQWSGERSSHSFGLGYARDSTLTSDFSATGVVDDNIPRETLSFDATTMQGFTERLAGNLRLGYQDVAYDGGLRYGLLDYRYWSAVGYTQFASSERSSTNVILRLAEVDVPLTGGGSREVSVGLGYDRSWDERWKLSLAAGPSFSEVNGGGTETGVSYRVGLTHAGERSNLELGAERLLSPNAGQGRLQTRDALQASYRRRLSEYLALTVFAGADLYTDVGQRNVTGSYESGTLRGGAKLAWRPSPDWSWHATYEHIQRDVDGSPQGNRLAAGVTWSGQRRSISR